MKHHQETSPNGLGVRGKILSEWQSARHLCICDDIRLFPNEVRRVYNQHESRNPHEVSYECFSYFNGVPEQILYDNMKTVVIKHSPVEIRFNRKFEDFLAYYGIVPKACRPKRPQTKGKVERTIKYLKDNFFQRKHEPTLHALNEAVRTWLDQIANKKTNQTTNESPFQRFEQEQKFLQI